MKADDAVKALERMAADKVAGFSFAIGHMWVMFYGKGPFNIDVIHAIQRTFVPFIDEDNIERSVALQVSDIEDPRLPFLTHVQEKQGWVHETLVNIVLPLGAEEQVMPALERVAHKFRLRVEELPARQTPRNRRLGAADAALAQLERLATWEEGEVEEDDPRNHKGEGSLIPSLAERRASDEEGKPTDPAENRCPEDAQKWEAMNEEHGNVDFSDWNEKGDLSRLASGKFDSLGTRWRFQVTPGKLGVVYTIEIEGTTYRIVPERLGSDRWRLDLLGMAGMIWEAATPKEYNSPEEAAKDLVKLPKRASSFEDEEHGNADFSDWDKVAGCEKLPEGPMRDNCEEKRDDGKDKDKTADAALTSLERLAADAVDEKDGKFEEGVSADPTKNMVPEDAKRWREEHEKHKDNFKGAGCEKLPEGAMRDNCEKKKDGGKSGKSVGASKIAKRIDKVWVVRDPRESSEWSEIVFEVSSDRLAPLIIGTGHARWQHEDSRLYDDLKSAEADGYARVVKLFGGKEKIPNSFWRVSLGGKPFSIRVGSVVEAEARPIGRSQTAILEYMMKTEGPVAITELAAKPPFRGVHFGDIERAVEALDQKGLVIYDGMSIEKTAGRASGLYGFPKSVQSDCETATRRIAKHAVDLARTAYGKDARTVDFLATHAKQADSLPAKVLVAAMKELAPKVPEDKLEDKPADAKETDDTEVDEKEGKKAGTRKFGLYGFPDRIARLGLQACTALREHVGHVAAELHGRRAEKHAHITGFLSAHAKEASCLYSQLLHSSYPDVSRRCASVPTTGDDWLTWEPESRTAALNPWKVAFEDWVEFTDGPYKGQRGRVTSVRAYSYGEGDIYVRLDDSSLKVKSSGRNLVRAY